MNYRNLKKNALFPAILLTLLCFTINSDAASHKLPGKYKGILGKKWTLQKVILEGNDVTEPIVKNQMKGVKVYYIFSKNGSVETNQPDATETIWKYKGNFFRIKSTFIVDGKKQTSSPYYTIVKVTGKTLRLDIKAMKMSYYYKSK